MSRALSLKCFTRPLPMEVLAIYFRFCACHIDATLSVRFVVSLSCSDLMWESFPLPAQHLDLENGDFHLPVSCGNFAFGHSRPSEAPPLT